MNSEEDGLLLVVCKYSIKAAQGQIIGVMSSASEIRKNPANQISIIVLILKLAKFGEAEMWATISPKGSI
uniref:Uncharacterized protein n=1 Tax=Romanomermis culicivorax TaxID=13658 RepID=A0A915KDR8_ROMCU